MNKKSIQLTQSTINFAARFGFITKDIFFEYFCHNMKSQQYHHWKSLTANGYFYPSTKQQGLAYLTLRGKKLSQFAVVQNASLYTLTHEILVSKIFLELSSTGLVLNSWTENELASDPYDTCLTLGVRRVDKLPDLLVDLKGKNKHLRIAIEVENTLKSKERYQRIGSSYLNMKNINLVVYGCANTAIQNVIRKIFSDPIYFREQKSPINFLTEGFKKNKLETEAWLLNRQMSFKNMLIAALEITPDEWAQNQEKNWKPFRENKIKDNQEKNEIPKEEQVVESPAQAPAPWQSLRDHPHSTMLIEGGHEPGAGVGRGPENTEEDKII